MVIPLIRKEVVTPRGRPAGRFHGRRAMAGFCWISAATIALVLYFAAAADSSGMNATAAVKTASPEKIPDFVLRDLEGRKFRLSDFKGKSPVMIIFTATWCTFCRDEIPRYKFIHETYAKRGLEMVNIDVMESKDKVAKFSAKYGLPYRVLLDEDGIVAGIFDVRGVPSVVLVDRNGKIICRECRRVEPLIESLLKNK